VPNFDCHVSVAAVVSAVGVAFGGAALGWDKTAASLAFLAGLSGGLLPDLDCDKAKPLRLAGAVAGVGCAGAVVGFVTSPGELLNRPWTAPSAMVAAVGAYFLFNAVAVEIIKRRTVHRGLFHSLAVPFLYGGLWAVLVASQGARTVMAVWLMAIVGVMTHLLLDAGKSMSFNPLKVATQDLGASTRLWILTALINLLAFTRVSLP
jgi:hypothetical protein